MRFAFTILDHRVSLSVAKYAAPGVTFEDTLQKGNLIPPLTRYTDPLFSGFGSDYWIAVDNGVTYEWIKKGNDLAIANGNTAGLSATGLITARAIPVKAAPSAAELLTWGGILPAQLPSLDGVTLQAGDVFLIQGTTADNGIYQTSDGLGNYTFLDSWASIGGVTNGTGTNFIVLGGATNTGKIYWSHPVDDNTDVVLFQEMAPGKIYFRLSGASGVLVTAGLTRVP